MNKNSLELHLQTICKENPEYTSLISTWNLNKKTCTESLKTVVASYPHFSMHDVAHAEAVVTKIEMLLGERVYKLSPTDTWLLLHAAYAHDLGMVLKWEDVESAWKDDKFPRFLNSMKQSSDNQLCKAANVVLSILEGTERSIQTENLLQLSQYVTLLNAAYFRKYHSKLSRQYIDLWEDGLKIDLGHSGLIQPRLIKLLGRICELHTAETEEILELDFETDGFGADYVHPRLIAMLLRIGDLLDADNGRFNATSTMTLGALTDGAVHHRDKHESIVHILVTPTDIEFRSDCPNQEVYLETRNFIRSLETEIEFWKKYWDVVTPKELGGYVPRFEKKEILIDGSPDIDGVAGLRFAISQDKAFQIIEGSNIYSDPFICFREMVQNALDASKLQMWKDVVSGNYVAWLEKTAVTKDIQPFEIDRAIYQNYPIRIALSTLPDGKTQVEVTDRGTGISVENFKRMCNVGVSTTSGDAHAELIESMPAWLKPTAGFGIGLQSIFLITESFEVITNTGTESYRAVIHSNRKGGYLQLHRQKESIARGTTIKVVFDMPSHYSYSFFGETMRFLHGEYDPFANADYLGEIRTIESIRTNCSDTMFPIFITSSVEQYKDMLISESVIADTAADWEDKCEGYRYQMNADGSKMDAWDTLNHTYGSVSLVKQRNATTSVSFKGIPVSKGVPPAEKYGLQTRVNIFGLETKDTLSLSRDTLISPGKRKVKEIINNITDMYVDKVIEELSISGERMKEICESQGFQPYAFWLSCNPEQRKLLPTGYIDYITDGADVLVRGTDGKFMSISKPVKEIIPQLTENTYFVPTRKFEGTLQKRTEIYEKIIGILNEHAKEDVQTVIVDSTVLAATGGYAWKTVDVLTGADDVVLFSITDNAETNLRITEEFRKKLIIGLGSFLEGVQYNNRFLQMGGKRFAIPSLSGYECLKLESIPFGIAHPDFDTHWIISPFTQPNQEDVHRLSKENFVQLVMESASFERLVEFVRYNHRKGEVGSAEDVRNAYKRLIEEYHNTVLEMSTAE